MITGIAIENFKGIRDRVKLELCPITLLFGANSAGKSTILHALHYAHEVFERRNLNPDLTISGGTFVDLGGFENLVYGHDRNLPVSVSLTLDNTLAEFDNLSFANFNNFEFLGIPDFEISMSDFCREFKEVEVTFVIAWSMTHNAAFISRYEVAIDGQFLASISSEVGRPESVLRFDSEHPIFLNCDEAAYRQNHPLVAHPLTSDELPADYTILAALWSWFAHSELIEGTVRSEEYRFVEVYIDQRHDALPDIENALPFRSKLRFYTSGEYLQYSDEYDQEISAVTSVVILLSRLIVGPARLARSALAKFRYLGPVRETPPRNYVPPRYPDDSRWASGLGAWDALYYASDQFVDKVGEWLGDPENLNAGCRVERRTYLEVDVADPVIRKLIDRRAFDDVDEDEGVDLTNVPRTSRIVVVPHNSEIELRPRDVGVGISQVVPVIVTALDGEERLLAIEQPELHIHPRLQADIADLFVETIQKNKHRFIIETHSEHLILRLLRRIRETEKGTAEAHRQLRTHDLAVYYVRQDNGCSTVSRIDVDVKGEFIQPWPDDFFEIDFYERFPDAR